MAGVFALFLDAGIFVQPLSGNAYDRIGLHCILPVLMDFIAVGMFLISFMESFWVIVAITSLLSSLFGQPTATLLSITPALPMICAAPV